MTEENPVHMPTRGKFEWNFNTIVVTIGFAIQLVAGGVTIGVILNKQDASDARQTARQDASDLKYASWISGHETLHRDRNGDARELQGRNEERFKSIEADTRKIENLNYRLTIQEQTSLTQSKVIEELKAAINTIASDVRVIKEITLRNDAAATGRSTN